MKRRYALLISLALPLLVISSAGSLALAQDSTPEATPGATAEATETQITTLSYGTPVMGSIDDSNIKQDWPLQVASADRVQVTVQRTSGNLIPEVQILDATGQSVADSYGADKSYATAQIDDTTLSTAGTFTVEVSRKDDENGVTTGGYSLVVTPLGTADDNPNNTTVIGDVQADTPVDGEVTATHWLQVYTYTAQAGDTLDVTAKRTGGTLAPVVYVLDANGQTLETGYNSYDSADTGNFDLNAAGQYTIEVSRYNDQKGDTLGTYELTVHLIGSGEGSPLLNVAAGTAVYDQELDGKITPAAWYQDWQLQTDAGDTITVTVNRTDGDLVPEIDLLGGSQQNLTTGYEDNTYASAQIDHYKLAGPGTYTIRVTRKDGQKGETSGAYSLTIALNGTGDGSPKLSQPVGEITEGQAATGAITNTQWQNVWTFNSADGGQIDVNVTRTDGTLSPVLAILDANGQQMTNSYASDSHDSSQISGYRLPGPGKYQIVVGREDDQSGGTTGKYSVTVSATPAS
ncbi:MAG TPA: hypothetical protein VHD90_14850 [Phototrophicaceae bacterium]|nr:hypothetical protein [Phototrophicaceae bacterium]